MPFEDRFAQIVKLFSALMALVPLAMCLVRVKASFMYIFRPALYATNAFRPAHRADYFKTFCIVYEVVYV